MRKLKDRVIQVRESGTWQKCSPAEQSLFSMVCSVSTNLLDVLVIDQPFYWEVEEWIELLQKYEVTKVIIDLQATNTPELNHFNGDKLVSAFIKAGYTKCGNIKSYVKGRDVQKLKGVILERSK